MLAQTDFPASVGIRKIQVDFVDWPGTVTDGIVFYFTESQPCCLSKASWDSLPVVIFDQRLILNCPGKEGQIMR